MFKILIFLFISLFLVSCTSKNNAFRYFDKAELEAKGVKATKKADIVKDKEVNVIFIATYLNQVDNMKDDTKTEDFLVFTYFSSLDSQNIEDNGYLFFLNENEPVSIEKIEKGNEKYKDLMLKNYWGNYYLVKFNNIEIDDDKKSFVLNLVLQDQASNKVTLGFAK
ncbi:conserved hypothetical protein [Aliarcobacter butzleri JV22]|uniref:hypothetical protein n=1 Tax=Aliarcobacter butzleri TaxID=28197 RepID=UPI0001F13D3A|nr:hypothetical protein [Aliarcobacter butzleri]EFU69265.1 conserved hypothetical protein [Aliarcobacter butzleri JV22]